MSLPSFTFGVALMGAAVLLVPALVDEVAESFDKVSASVDVQLTPATPPASAPAPSREMLALQAILDADPSKAKGRHAPEMAMLQSQGVIPGTPEKLLHYPLFDFAGTKTQSAGSYHAFCSLSQGQTSATVLFRNIQGNGAFETSYSTLNEQAQVAIAADNLCARAAASGAFDAVPAMPWSAMNKSGVLTVTGDLNDLADQAVRERLAQPTGELAPPLDISEIKGTALAKIFPGARERIIAQDLGVELSNGRYWNVCTESLGQVTGTVTFVEDDANHHLPAAQVYASRMNEQVDLYLAAQKHCARVMTGLTASDNTAAPTDAG